MPKRQPSDMVFHRTGNLRPPKGLPVAAATLWAAIMASTPTDQWRPGDLPLLTMFCRTSLLADDAVERLERDGQLDTMGKPSAWVKVAADHGKTLALLAGKLRLCPSSRSRPEDHVLQKRPGRKIWESATDDELLAGPQ